MPELSAAERAIGYRFSDRTLLGRCFVHSSLAEVTGEESNERLEFLGDAVVQLYVTDLLYHASSAREGVLTAMRQNYVSRGAMEAACEALGLMQYLRRTGDVPLHGKTAANLFEAVAGAIFADGGFKAAEKFVKKTLLSAHLKAPINYKGALQEYVQAQGRPLPEYNTRRSGGTPNAPEFVCDVLVCGRSFTGTGGSKGEAEKSAAKSALGSLHGD